MTIASKYNPQTAWRAVLTGVFQLTRETTLLAATYRATVKAVDTNDPGANQKAIGYYLVDYWGTPYLIIGVGSTTVDVSDDFRTGKCPTSGRNAIIYQSVFKGRALYLAPDSFRHLHPLAMANSHRFDMALLWANDPNAKHIPFTLNNTPTITGYQSNQLDGFNLAEDYGEDPQVRCIIEVDANTRYERQQMPQFTYVSGLIDTIFFDLGDGNDTPYTGYIIISK